jgi:hypothetical protein
MQLKLKNYKFEIDFHEEFYKAKTIEDLPEEWLSEYVCMIWIDEHFCILVDWYPVYNIKHGQFIVQLFHRDRYKTEDGKYSNFIFFFKRTRSLQYLTELLYQANIKALKLIEIEKKDNNLLRKYRVKKRLIVKNRKLYLKGIKKYLKNSGIDWKYTKKSERLNQKNNFFW